LEFPTSLDESNEKPPRPPRYGGRGVWIAAIFWMAIIFGTSCRFISRDAFLAFILPLIPGDEMRRAFTSSWDNLGGLIVVKGYHMAEFALLFLLSNAVLRKGLHFPRHIAARYCVLFCVLFAISDEWHQTFIPGRGGTWVDVAIDSVGILLAVLLTARYSGWAARRASNDSMTEEYQDTFPPPAG
jgi:hypothetical protein